MAAGSKRIPAPVFALLHPRGHANPSKEIFCSALQVWESALYRGEMQRTNATSEFAPNLVSRCEAARALGVQPLTLARWAALGRGPRFARHGKVGGRIYYAVEDLRAWLEAHQTALDGTKTSKSYRLKM